MIWKDLELLLSGLALMAQPPSALPCPVFPKRQMCDIRAGSVPAHFSSLPAWPALGVARELGPATTSRPFSPISHPRGPAGARCSGSALSPIRLTHTLAGEIEVCPCDCGSRSPCFPPLNGHFLGYDAGRVGVLQDKHREGAGERAEGSFVQWKNGEWLAFFLFPSLTSRSHSLFIIGKLLWEIETEVCTDPTLCFSFQKNGPWDQEADGGSFSEWVEPRK